MSQSTPETARSAGGPTQKYLTFNLGSEQYGIEILKVREIIGLMEITRVPRTPDFVRGVVNLRGKVVPVIHMRTKFGMETIPDTDQTCIIVADLVVKNAALQMGIIVDSVSEVLDIETANIEETPSFGTTVHTEFIQGIAKTKGGVKILLNIENVLTTDELHALSTVTAADDTPAEH